MTITEAITEAKKLTGIDIDTNTARRWLSELDGQLAFDVWGADAWIPYTSEDDSLDLAVAFPWDGDIYVPFLSAKMYQTYGELDRYENARTMYETALWEFRRYLVRTHMPIRVCCMRHHMIWHRPPAPLP